MVDRLARYLATLSLAFWIGGLTLYALVVVPIGTKITGGTQQGFVTQQVTVWLNWIGVVSLVMLVPNLRARWMRGTWGVLAVTLAALFALHQRLDALLASGETSHFYDWHRAYLIVTAVQWLAGVVHLWGVVQATPEARPT